MEIYFLDKALMRMSSPFENVISAVWKLRFFECGTFRVVLPLTSGVLKAAVGAEYICAVAVGSVRCGRIEKVETGTDEIEISGRLPECLLSDRVIEYVFLMVGRADEAVLSAVSENSRDLPMVMGEDSDVIEDEGFFFGAWDNLSGWVYRALKPYNASLAVEFDPGRGVFVYRVVASGRDCGAVFSSSFGNIVKTEYRCNSASRKNKIYVQGDDGTVVELDASDGEAKQEIFCRAGDLELSMFETMSDYRAALMMRAKEELAKHQNDEQIVCTMAGGEYPVFGRDYRLGDLCGIVDEQTGIFRRGKVVGVDEGWENGGKLPAVVTFAL